MNRKLILINLALIVFPIGLISTISLGTESGASIVLGAASLVLAAGMLQILDSFQKNQIRSRENLIYLLAIFVLAVIFLHGFSVAIARPFLGNVPEFSSIYLASGLILILVFLFSSIRQVKNLNDPKKKLLFISILSIVSLLSFLGLLGMARIFPFSGWLITYSIMSLCVCYLVFFVHQYLSSEKANKTEILALALLCFTMIAFLIIRFKLPFLLPQGFTNSIISFGFVPAIILPLSIIYAKRFYFFIVFLLFFTSMDFYLIHTDRNFNTIINIGENGCVGYENATEYALNNDPGTPVETLLKEPAENELNNILTEWKKKNFTPNQIQIAYETVKPNGDTIKVVSHLVNGQKHYGLIRIPKMLDIPNAPILLGLMGGGTGMDVLKTGDINRLSSGKCRELLDNYISIIPSYRGNVLRGEEFCFRSEGYTGDVWLGPAEDAVAFLEVVKFMYNKTDSTKVLAKGISRGATVALIIGGLTDKVDYIIANSTHTKFLDAHVLYNEGVGGSFSRAFYTPKTNSEDIRKRIIASSPYYFLDKLPPFEIHQGTEDQKTTIWHARAVEDKLKETGINDSTKQIIIYEGKGHGYDDDTIICKRLEKFLNFSLKN
jgi:hypothetical protein